MKNNSKRAMKLTIAWLCLLWAGSAQPLHASLNIIIDTDSGALSGQHYYVSVDGNDAEIGSIDKPWKTIHKALSTIAPDEDDSVVVIRSGTYKIPKAMHFDAARGGSKGKYFTVKAYKDEEVIIDGSLLTLPSSAMASFNSAAYVLIKGLTFANLKGPKSAIYIEGASHHIQIINNKLQDMTWADDPSEDELKPTSSDHLNPIAVIGNNATQAINNIFIRGNQLSDIALGYSEGIKIIGHVTDFVVSRNHIHNITNTGIIAAGNYAWVKDSSNPAIPLRKRLTIPARLNHARNGVIRNNVVHNAISPVTNSAGIFLDGARNMTVRDNVSYNNSVGFAVSCEQPGDSTGNTLTGNIAYGNVGAGLVVGAIHKRAAVNNTTIVNNEFRNNYTKGGHGGEMRIQAVNGLEVDNNLFSSLSDVIIVVSQPATNLSLNRNLYYGASKNPKTAIFDWTGIAGKPYVGLNKFRAATCNDLSSIYQDATSIEYFTRIKNSIGSDKQLSQIRRVCYRGNKIW